MLPRLWLLVASALLSSTGVSAESDPGLTEHEFLGDVPVVLSVSRLAQPLNEAPAPVTVIDRSMIEASGFRDLPQVMRLVPGFAVVAQRGGFPSVMYGVDDDFARRMQVLVDGRSIYTPSFGGVEWSNLPLELEDVERIEVIRGPNAATYGANSFFGVINIVTRHAAQEPGGFVSLTKGDHNVEHGVARYGGQVGRLAYRISAGYHQDAGFATLSDTVRTRRISLRTDTQLSDYDSLQVQAGYNEGTDALGRVGAQLDPPRQNDIDSYFAQLRWQRTLSTDSELSLQYYRTRYSTTDEFGIVVAPGVSVPLDFDSTAVRDNLELQHTLKPLANLRLVWGGELRRDEVRSRRYFNKPSVRNDLKRLFANAEWRPAPRVLLNAGAMWESNDITGSDVSPRLALNYLLTDNHTLRLSISQANRTPVLLEEQADASIQVGALTNRLLLSSGGLRPEQITSVELGYLGRWSDGKLAVDMRVHRDDVEDIVSQTRRITAPPQNGARDFANSGDLTLSGFETQLRLSPTRSVSLLANYSYVDIKPKNFTGANGLRAGDFQGFKDVMPKHNIALLGTARFTERLRGSLGYYRLSGASWAGGDKLPPTTKLDMRLAYEFKLAGQRSEIAVVAQDIYGDYLELERNNERDMRAYVNFTTRF